MTSATRVNGQEVPQTSDNVLKFHRRILSNEMSDVSNDKNDGSTKTNPEKQKEMRHEPEHKEDINLETKLEQMRQIFLDYTSRTNVIELKMNGITNLKIELEQMKHKQKKDMEHLKDQLATIIQEQRDSFK